MIYINNPSLLDEAAQSIGTTPWAALDTEGDSLHHYVEKLCLVQVTVGNQDFVIDPLAAMDLTALMLELSKKDLILHGADFDLRILKKNFGFAPKRVFDTMIAGQLLGYDKQGLADLAKRHCDVSLPKSAQKADWSERPLEDELLVYAANDTHFLKTIHDIMRQELVEKGRLSWHEQCCEKLVNSIRDAKEGTDRSETAWQIKGSKELKGLSLTILKELWHWRENEAKRRDRPSFKVLNSEILIDVSRWGAERTEEDIALMPKAPRNVRHEHRALINEIIQKSKSLQQAHWVKKNSYEFKHGKSMSDASKVKLGLLKEERDKIGAELAIQPSLIVTNAALERIAGELPKNREALEDLKYFMPWQLDVAAERFINILLV